MLLSPNPFTAPSSTSTEKLPGLVDELLVADTGSARVITAQAVWLEEHASRRLRQLFSSPVNRGWDSHGRRCVKGESTPWTHFWPVQNSSNPS